ncbi:MAG: hypothetical protein IJ795_02480 [Bacteroidales bacterium]|nr:hypothetical protein [Bacteroidales bacterium]
MNKVFAPIATLLITAACSVAPQGDRLVFEPSSCKTGSLTLPTGKKVDYKAYERLYFVTNVEDSTYQYMNVYVPEGATQKTPIFLRKRRCRRKMLTLRSEHHYRT